MNTWLHSEHPETAEVMYDLAQLREAQDSNLAARSLYIQVLAIREQTLGRHHPKTTETRKHLITLLRTLDEDPRETLSTYSTATVKDPSSLVCHFGR